MPKFIAECLHLGDFESSISTDVVLRYFQFSWSPYSCLVKNVIYYFYNRCCCSFKYARVRKISVFEKPKRKYCEYILPREKYLFFYSPAESLFENGDLSLLLIFKTKKNPHSIHFFPGVLTPTLLYYSARNKF